MRVRARSSASAPVRAAGPLRLGQPREGGSPIAYLAVALLSSVLLGSTLAAYAVPDLGAARGSVAEIPEKGVVAVMFWSESCPSCLEVIGGWRELEASPPPGVTVLDVAYEPGVNDLLFAKYDVTVTPTYLLIVDGKVVARHEGKLEGRNATDAALRWLTSALASEGASGERSAPLPLSGLGLASYAVLGLLLVASPCILPAVLVLVGTGSAASLSKRECVVCGASTFAGVLALGLLLLTAASLAKVVVPGAVTAIASAAVMLGAYALWSGSPIRLPAGVLKVGSRLACFGVGIMAAQCNLPLVGGSLLLAGASPDPVAGVLNVAVLGAGASAALTALMLTARKGSAAVSALAARATHLGRLGGLFLVLLGAYTLAARW